MANTVSRTVELQLKLTGAQSIAELEEVTQEINQELKQMNTNSKEFSTMGNLAKQANSKVKEVGESLGGITSTEKAEAVNKMGQGLVGAFQAAAGASLIFGEKTSAEMQKVIGKVGGLFAVTDGLKKVTEAFSAKNIAGLKATVKGWQESAVAAKLFGTTTRAAIASTGIGLIVIILASIISNWDKVKASAVKAANAVKDFFPPIRWVMDAVDSIKEKFGSLGNLIKGVGAAIASIFTKETMAEAFTEAVEEAKALDAATQAYKETITDTNDEFENQITLLGEIGGKEQEILDLQKERNQKIIDGLKNIEKHRKLTDEETKSLKDAVFQVELLGVKQDNLNKKKAADNKAAQEKAAADKKAAEEKAKKDAEELKATYEKIRGLEGENNLAAELNRITLEGIKINADLNNLYANNEDLLGEVNKLLEDVYKTSADINKTDIFMKSVASSQELLELDKQRREVLADETLTQKERENLIKNITDAENKYTEDLKKNSDGLLNNLKREEVEKYALLALDKERLEVELDAQDQILSDLKDKAEWAATDLENAIAAGKAEKEILALTEKKLEAEKAANEATAEYRDIQAQITDATAQQNDLLVQGVKNASELPKVQLTGLQKYGNAVDNFFEKYGELVQGVQDLTSASFDLAIANAEAQAEKDIELLEAKAEKEIEIEEGKIDAFKELQEDYTDSLLELNSLLADANGENYEDILDQIELEKQAKQQAIDDELAAEANKAAIEAQLEADKEAAQKKANKLKKQQSIVEAVINTALSVVSALKAGFPLGLVMAGVYAALGAVQIATISKQPTYAQGGYTGDGSKYEAAGIVHKGEYVIPQKIVRNPAASAMIETLEGMRLRGYAEGGTVTAATANIPTAENMLDYKRIGDEVARAMKENPMYVSWVEWRDTDAKARWVMNRAGLGRR